MVEEEEAAARAATGSCPEFVGTENALRALIDHLVNPLLSVNDSSPEPPTLSHQQSVAKQMHAVVLLYNYYHRKQFPQLEFLDLESFCKAASFVKQGLLVYTRFTHRSEEESGILEKQLSVTEEMVLGACNICTGLDMSENSCIRGTWPVSKVSVLLIDSTRKNCILLFSSITRGVWSPLEKDVGTSFGDHVGAPQTNNTDKKGKNVNKLSEDGFLPKEDTFLQLALSAVKEKTGIDVADLTVLECHIAYSLSQEMTTACFYLVQYKQAIIKEDVAEFAIDDVMDSLQGPLVRNDLTVTPVVEYFHLLPYLDILSGWLSRPKIPDGLLTSPVEQADVAGSDRLEPEITPAQDSQTNYVFYWSGQIAGNMCKKAASSKTESISVIENRSCTRTKSSGYPFGSHNKANASCLNCPPQESMSKDAINFEENVTADKHNHKRKRISFQISPSVPKFLLNDKADVVGSVKKPCSTKHKDARLSAGNDGGNAGCPVQDEKLVKDLPLVPMQVNVQNSDKLQVVMESKRGDLLATSIKVLQKRREELHHKRCLLEDEIAQCEMHLQKILSGEESLMLELDLIVETCNSLCSSRAHMGKSLFYGDPSPSQAIIRKRLSEAVLSLHNPCQELDAICYENNWTLPRYNVHPSHTNGGFYAVVMVQGLDFECTVDGDLKSTPLEARDSAAAHMLSQLRSMASLSQ